MSANAISLTFSNGEYITTAQDGSVWSLGAFLKFESPDTYVFENGEISLSQITNIQGDAQSVLEAILNQASGRSLRRRISNDTWSPPVGTKSYTVRVVVSSGSEFTDSEGITDTLDDNEVFTYSWPSATSDTLPVVTATAGANIVITYITN